MFYYRLQVCFHLLFRWAAFLNIWSHVQVFKMLIAKLKTENTKLSEQTAYHLCLDDNIILADFMKSLITTVFLLTTFQ
jgi:hypothetical protein